MKEFFDVLTDLSQNTPFLIVVLFAMACIQYFMRPLKNYAWAHWVVSVASLIFYIILIFLAITFAPIALEYF